MNNPNNYFEGFARNVTQPWEPDPTRRSEWAERLKPVFLKKPLETMNLAEKEVLGMVHFCADLIVLAEDKGNASQVSDIQRMVKKFKKAKKHIEKKANSVGIEEVIDGDYDEGVPKVFFADARTDMAQA